MNGVLDKIASQVHSLAAGEPEFYPVPALRAVDSSLPPTLRDVESHMPAGHAYRHADKATWVHETTHGLNARIRNKYRAENGYPKINAFYVLSDRAVVIEEPNITINQVAAVIPSGLRGRLYPQYLVNAQRHWNDRPLYVFDEWISYCHDSRVSRELGRPDFSGAAEFTNYAVYVALVSGFSAVKVWKFLLWQMKQLKELTGV